MFVKRSSRRSLLEADSNNQGISPSIFVKRRSSRSLLELESQNRSLSPQRRESVFIKRGSRRSLLGLEQPNRSLSPQRRESVLVKRSSRRSLLEPEQNRSVSPTLTRQGSFNNTPKISNKVKFGSKVIPKISNKIKIGKEESPKTTSAPKLGGGATTPNSSNTQTPRTSNKHTPKASNVTATNKPVRRINSETFAPISQINRRDGGLRKVLSERRIGATAQPSPPSSRLMKLKEELRQECRSINQRKELQDDCRQQRRKSWDHSEDPTPSKKSPKGGKKKEKTKERTPRKPKRRSRSRSRSQSRGEESQRNDSVDRQNSDSGGLLRGKRPVREEQDLPEQPKRFISLNAPMIEIRKNKRSYLRKTTSLTESSKGRRKLVDECIGARGMMPHLE